MDSPRHSLVVCESHYAWTVAYGLPLSCLLWPYGVVYCLWPFSSCILAAYGRTGPSVRPHAPSMWANIIVGVHASFRCRADGGCVSMLGQSTASPCPSAGGGSRHGGMSVTCVIATLDAITVWRSGQWGYRFLPMCGHHCACACILVLSC